MEASSVKLSDGFNGGASVGDSSGVGSGVVQWPAKSGVLKRLLKDGEL